MTFRLLMKQEETREIEVRGCSQMKLVMYLPMIAIVTSRNVSKVVLLQRPKDKKKWNVWEAEIISIVAPKTSCYCTIYIKIESRCSWS